MVSPKMSVAINIVMAVLGIIASSTSYFTDMFGSQVAMHVVETAGFTLAIVGGINGVLHAYSSPRAGPMVTTK